VIRLKPVADEDPDYRALLADLCSQSSASQRETRMNRGVLQSTDKAKQLLLEKKQKADRKAENACKIVKAAKISKPAEHLQTESPMNSVKVVRSSQEFPNKSSDKVSMVPTPSPEPGELK
jgi:Zn-dependent metalloprotease